MGDDSMTLEEQKQILIDNYINLMRIKLMSRAPTRSLNTRLR